MNRRSKTRYRVGLKPVMRRIWVDELAVPIANVNWRFQWLWLYGFVQPRSGQTYWWILPYVNIQLFNRVLEDFARHFSIGKTLAGCFSFRSSRMAYQRPS